MVRGEHARHAGIMGGRCNVSSVPNGNAFHDSGQVDLNDRMLPGAGGRSGVMLQGEDMHGYLEASDGYGWDIYVSSQPKNLLGVLKASEHIFTTRIYDYNTLGWDSGPTVRTRCTRPKPVQPAATHH